MSVSKYFFIVSMNVKTEYEDLFNMEELCGIPLKQYEGQFTFKLNKYTREEKDEVIRRTGYSENYELH